MRLIFTKDHENVNQKSYWVAKLSNGKEVFEDCIPHIKSTWKRLEEYLVEKTNLNIDGLALHFMDQTIILPDNAEGYFMRKSEYFLGGVASWMRRGIGYVKNNKIFVTWVGPDGIKHETLPLDSNTIGVIMNHGQNKVGDKSECVS